MSLHVVRPFDIPLTTSKPRLVAHARRVAELARAYSAALPAIPRSEQEAFADVMPLGVALSHVRDLGIGPNTAAAVSLAAFLTATDLARMHAAFTADAPRYQPPATYGRCPVPGSRGGKCNERGRTGARWVTDVATGVWERREMCDLHLPVAAERVEAAPAPASNRGGVLAAVFLELNISKWYRWAVPGWTEDGQPEPVPAPVVGERPVLRLVDGAGT